MATWVSQNLDTDLYSGERCLTILVSTAPSFWTQWLSRIFPFAFRQSPSGALCGKHEQLGAVASESRECSEIGRDLLALGVLQ